MKYTLYITDHCTSCRKVLTYLKTTPVEFAAINLDAPGQEWPDRVMIVPALVQENRLLAVGPDIQDYIERKLSA